MARLTGLGRLPSIALLIAVASSLGFLAVGFMVPVYEGLSSTSESPVVTETSSTLVAENGSWAVVVLLFPLVAAVIVATALLGSARPAAIVLAWSVTGTVAVFNLLAMLTIGIFLVPTTIALVAACTSVTVKQTASRSVVGEAR